MPPSLHSGLWSKLEKDQLHDAIVQFGWGNWKDVNKFVPTRNKKQIKSHAQKMAVHRPEEKAELEKRHAAAMKKEEEEKCSAASAASASVPMTTKKSATKKKSVRRSSRLSAHGSATAKAAATPVKVRRTSKSSISETPDKVTTSKPALAKAKKLSNEASKKPKLSAQIKKLFIKSDPSEKTMLLEDKSTLTQDSDVGVHLMEIEIPSQLAAAAEHVQSATIIKSGAHDNKPAALKSEETPIKCRFDMGNESTSSFPLTVTPSSSMRSSVEEAEEIKVLMSSLDSVDPPNDDVKGMLDDSFTLALDDIFDIELEDKVILQGVADVVDDDSLASVNEQQIRSRALMPLRLEVQPNERALNEITAILESSSSSTSESKSTAMRQSIIKLATAASEVRWWRDSNMVTLVRQAHLEHLVALTFAVLQADAWTRSYDEARFNAEDDIRHICQLIQGIWNRVNHYLMRDGYDLFHYGIDHLERRNAVNKMVSMFDNFPRLSD